MSMQPVIIPLHPHSEPQRRWVERSAATVERYLAATYGDGDDGRALDGTFLHIAADVIWDMVPESPDWHRLSVVALLLHLAEAPAWDDAWLLHACATLAAFYRWLHDEQLIGSHDVAAILAELDERIAETMTSLGLLAGGRRSN